LHLLEGYIGHQLLALQTDVELHYIYVGEDDINCLYISYCLLETSELAHSIFKGEVTVGLDTPREV
jgi:hypothetical protein